MNIGVGLIKPALAIGNLSKTHISKTHAATRKTNHAAD